MKTQNTETQFEIGPSIADFFNDYTESAEEIDSYINYLKYKPFIDLAGLSIGAISLLLYTEWGISKFVPLFGAVVTVVVWRWNKSKLKQKRLTSDYVVRYILWELWTCIDNGEDYEEELTKLHFVNRKLEIKNNEVVTLINKLESNTEHADISNKILLEELPKILKRIYGKEKNFVVIENTEPFIHVDGLNDRYFKRLITEINQCHRIGSSRASIVLSRTLIDGLMINIMQLNRGIDPKKTYYNEENNEYHSGTTLLDEFIKGAKDYQAATQKFEPSIKKTMEENIHIANKLIHTVDSDLSDEKNQQVPEKYE